MFEVHGWVTVHRSPENRDSPDEEVLEQAAVEKVQTYIRHLAWVSNPSVDIRWMNGQAHVYVQGFRNHSAGIREELLELFRFIGAVALGSYGLLYTLDDEDSDHSNEFRVYVLARGKLAERGDPFLSPFIPVVEDPAVEH